MRETVIPIVENDKSMQKSLREDGKYCNVVQNDDGNFHFKTAKNFFNIYHFITSKLYEDIVSYN